MAKQNDWWQAFAYVGTLGLQLTACVAVGLLAGRQLDAWLATAPWGTTAGIVLGFLAGLWSIYRNISQRQG